MAAQNKDKGVMLTVGEAAEVLGVSAVTLRRWDASGAFPAKRHPVYNFRMYPKAAVEKLKRQIETGRGA